MGAVQYFYASSANTCRLAVQQISTSGTSYGTIRAAIQAYGPCQTREAYINCSVGSSYSWQDSTQGHTVGSGWNDVFVKTFNVWYLNGLTRSFTISGGSKRQVPGGSEWDNYMSGTFTMDTAATMDTATFSGGTLGSSGTFTITKGTTGNLTTLSYSIGGASGTIVTQTSGTGVTWTPPTSLGAQITSAFSGTATITLTSYTADGSLIGSSTFDITLTVPTYTYSLGSMTAARGTKYSAVSAYVAGKCDVALTMPSFPSVMYNATSSGTLTITGSGNTLYTGTVASGQTVSFVSPISGTITATLVFADSRSVSASTSASVTYIANVLPSITSLSAIRTGSISSTDEALLGEFYYVDCSASYEDITGNTATLSVTDLSDVTGSGGTATASGHGSLSAASAKTFTATVVDALGNRASATVLVPTAFAYLQVGGGYAGKGVSIGKAASRFGTSSFEVGLPTVLGSYFTLDEDDVGSDSKNPYRIAMLTDEHILEAHTSHLIALCPIGTTSSAFSTSPACMFGTLYLARNDNLAHPARIEVSMSSVNGSTTLAKTYRLQTVGIPIQSSSYDITTDAIAIVPCTFEVSLLRYAGLFIHTGTTNPWTAITFAGANNGMIPAIYPLMRHSYTADSTTYAAEIYDQDMYNSISLANNSLDIKQIYTAT